MGDLYRPLKLPYRPVSTSSPPAKRQRIECPSDSCSGCGGISKLFQVTLDFAILVFLLTFIVNHSISSCPNDSSTSYEGLQEDYDCNSCGMIGDHLTKDCPENEDSVELSQLPINHTKAIMSSGNHGTNVHNESKGIKAKILDSLEGLSSGGADDIKTLKRDLIPKDEVHKRNQSSVISHSTRPVTQHAIAAQFEGITQNTNPRIIHKVQSRGSLI
jgi:hypothetical protein